MTEKNQGAEPRPQGGKHGDENEVELHRRAKFLNDTQTKVVEAPPQAKPKGTSGAQTK